jgi:hypothetical protein
MEGATLDARVICGVAVVASAHAHVAAVGASAGGGGADVDMYSAIVIGRRTGGADCPINPMLALTYATPVGALGHATSIQFPRLRRTSSTSPFVL